jgi:hypothetical protein
VKANIPTTIAQLSPSERQKLTALLMEQENRDLGIMLDLFLKMTCCILHDACGMGEDDLYAYLGNYRQFFRRQQKLVKEERQIEELDRRMAEIFPTSGYPTAFFESMFGELKREKGFLW